MTITGKISSIIYSNETNSYKVLLVKSESNGYITCVGSSPEVSVGDKLEFEGEFITHKVYGEQFSFSKVSKLLPTDMDSLITYIAKSSVRGVGEKTVEKIVKEFGEDSINVIRFESEKLNVIKGLNEGKIEALSKYINEEWERWNTVSFLSKYSVDVSTAIRIYETLGVSAIDVIKENPYALLEFVNKLDFKTTDKLALSLNIPKNNKERIKSGILYILTWYLFNEGSTCLEIKFLEEQTSKLLQISIEDIDIILKNMIALGIVTTDTIGGIDYVYRQSIYLAEQNIASKIINMTKSKTKIRALDEKINKVCEDLSIVPSEEQLEAIKNSMKTNISVITGGPGTGKTTIIKCIIDLLKIEDMKFVLSAPTGRAAARITDLTGENAKTIHRLLEIGKIEDTDLETVLNVETKIIDADVVIVDEVSMIDTMLMNNLLKSIKENTKLILVGDAYQLPSVGPGKVLKNIIGSGVVLTTNLTTIYRQSKKSDIIVNAHRVKNGQNVLFKDSKTDLYFIPTESELDTSKTVENLVSGKVFEYLPNTYTNAELEIQVLTPMKKNILGVSELNKVLQKNYINPKDGMKCKKYMDKIFYISDKVMQIKNNYDITYESDNGTRGTGIYNGDIGYITDISNENEYMIIDFDGRKVKYDYDNLDELEHAYAVTVHKSQGSEFDIVIIPLYTCFEKLFNRNLIYTAMTRAKKLLIFVGRQKVIEYMINNTKENKRCTGLEYKLKKLK